MPADLWFGIAFILMLIIANGFFSGSEMAVVSVRRSRIDHLAEEGQRAAQVVGRLKDEPDRFLATVQIGVTLVSSLGSAIGGALAVEHLAPLFAQTPLPLASESSDALAIGTVVVIISYLSLVLGELVPKSLALRYSEQVAFLVARPLDFFSWLFTAGVKLLTASTNGLLHLTGTGAKAVEAVVSEDEVKYIIREGAEKGVFDETEQEFIQSVFDFADTSVREVMTPRTEIQGLAIQTATQEALSAMIESSFSRMPIFEEDLDQIVGIVHIKELLRGREQNPQSTIQDFLHTAYFVPDSMQISHLLRELQLRRVQMSIVVNEFGTVVGIATIEDLLEEIVGEIQDEFDVDEELPVQDIGPDSWLVAGGVTLDDLQENPGLPVEETNDYRTLAGFLLARLERIPRGGEIVQYEGYRMTIVNMDGRRIDKIKVEKMPGGISAAAPVVAQQAGEKTVG
jgi:putative hemolysin